MFSEEILRDSFPLASFIGQVRCEGEIEEWKVDSLTLAHGRVCAHDGQPQFSAHLYFQPHLYFDEVLIANTLSELLHMVLFDSIFVCMTDAWSRVAQFIAEHCEGASVVDFKWCSPFAWRCALVGERVDAHLEYDESLDVYVVDFGDLRVKYADLRSALDGLILRCAWC